MLYKFRVVCPAPNSRRTNCVVLPTDLPNEMYLREYSRTVHRRRVGEIFDKKRMPLFACVSIKNPVGVTLENEWTNDVLEADE